MNKCFVFLLTSTLTQCRVCPVSVVVAQRCRIYWETSLAPSFLESLYRLTLNADRSSLAACESEKPEVSSGREAAVFQKRLFDIINVEP